MVRPCGEKHLRCSNGNGCEEIRGRRPRWLCHVDRNTEDVVMGTDVRK